MKTQVSITNDNNTIHLGIVEKDVICGDFCYWCGECIACAQPPVHATKAREAHTHYMNLTETEARNKGIEVP